MWHGMLVPWPVIKPMSPALEHGISTIGPPEKFPSCNRNNGKTLFNGENVLKIFQNLKHQVS